MALSNPEIQERIKAPKRKNQLQKAIKHEQWLRFHAQESLGRAFASRYLADFEEWVSGLLPSDKFLFFQKMMNFPIYTNELCTSMQDEFNKVFDSQNSSFTYDFTNESHGADFRQYLTSINFWQKWQHDAKEAMIKRVSSICIVDMPSEPGEETQPYFYFQDIAAVIDIDYHKSYYEREENELSEYTVIEHILLRQGEDKILFIDEDRYAVFEKDGEEYRFKSEFIHGLGYCPACFFWQDAIDKNEPIVKKSLITGALGNLDFLLLGETARRCNEIGAAFPIIVAYEEDCTYYKEVDNNTYRCVSGIIDTPNGQLKCPVCEKNRLIGPGTVFKVPAPKERDDHNLIDAVNIVSPDEASLKYWKERSDSLWNEIYYDCVGSGGDAMTQAINKDQVKGNFESKLNVLLKAKSNIEVSHKFVVSTIARLRYETSFIGCSINYGTKFYLQTATEAQKEYKDAVDSGVPGYLLGYKREQVDMANTKGNPVDAQKLYILQHLEPWVNMSVKDAKDLGLDEVDQDKFSLKTDFSDRILRFESEYGSIIEFAKKRDFRSKIDIITNVLLSYGKNQQQ